MIDSYENDTHIWNKYWIEHYCFAHNASCILETLLIALLPGL